MSAQDFLERGCVFFDAKEYSQAFTSFKNALTLRPDFAAGLEDTFATCLCEWGNKLACQQDYTTLFTSYKDGLSLFPNNKVILYNFGAHLLSFGHYNEASEMFKLSLNKDPTFLPPFRGLQTVSSHVVERWHFRMLNDHKRNIAFKDAIDYTVKFGKHSIVLDIGCGTGILSMFACKAGAQFAHACECNQTMASYAEKIIHQNRLSHKIRVIKKKSTDVKLLDDYLVRSSLVVTETFDAALVGEGVIPSLVHALRKLAKMASNVIPWKGTLYAVAVESSQLAKKYKTLGMPRAQVSLPELFSSGHEPYDTCNLSSVPDAAYLSSEIDLFHINFQELDQLQCYNNGIRKKVTFNFNQSGFFDFIVVWFKLQLTEDISISTRPGEESCWDQAIFPIPGSQFVRKGETVSHKFYLRKDKLTLELEKKKGVPMPTISFLNDIHATSEIENWLNCLKLPQDASILQVTPYPVMGPIKDTDRKITFIMSEKEENFFGLIESIKTSYPDLRNQIKFHEIDALDDMLANHKFHAMAINLVEPNGELNEPLVQLIPQLRFGLINSDDWAVKIFPSHVTVYCQLITSETLYACSTIVDDNVSTKFRGFQLLNDLNCQQMFGLRRGELGMIAASEPTFMAKLSLDKLCEDVCVKYFSQVEATGSVHAIAYWFIPQGGDTASQVKGDISSVDHWADLAVQMVHPPLVEAAGSTVQIELLYRIGLVKLSAHIAED